MKFALIGKNIGYSKSKEIFNTDFNSQYDVFDIDEDKIPETIDYLKKYGYTGFNVTTPYKEIICKYIDNVEIVGCGVNIVRITPKGKTIGCSRDGFSMRLAFEDCGITDFLKTAKSVAILGNGSVVPSILYELSNEAFKNVKQFTLYARNHRNMMGDNRVNKQPLSEFKVNNHDVIINTIPFKSGFDIDFTCDHPFVYFDLNYADDTLIKKAKDCFNCKIAENGYRMLWWNAKFTNELGVRYDTCRSH